MCVMLVLPFRLRLHLCVSKRATTSTKNAHFAHISETHITLVLSLWQFLKCAVRHALFVWVAWRCKRSRIVNDAPIMVIRCVIYCATKCSTNIPKCTQKTMWHFTTDNVLEILCDICWGRGAHSSEWEVRCATPIYSWKMYQTVWVGRSISPTLRGEWDVIWRSI